MRGFEKVGVQSRRHHKRISFTGLYALWRMARGLYRLMNPKRKKVSPPRVTEKALRLQTLANLREGIPPGDGLTIVCGKGVHRVVHDRTGYDITTLVAYVADLPLARTGIAMHEYELMRSVINLLVGDHEVTFRR